MTHLSLVIPFALLVHLIFKLYEPRLPAVWFLLLLGVPLTLHFAGHAYFKGLETIRDLSILELLAGISLHNVVLLLSIGFYRLSPFHPLAKYPGPALARLSNIWIARVVASGKRHLVLKALHDKYGSHVRIGPNTLSVANCQAIRDGLSHTGMPRGDPYLAFTPDNDPLQLITCYSQRIPEHDKLHAAKRDLWNMGFTSSALKGYDQFIQNRSRLLVERLGELQGPIDLAEWCTFFTFDIMGDVVYGGAFEMLREGKDTVNIISTILTSLQATTILAQFPWVNNLMGKIPLSGDMLKMMKFSEDKALERIRRGPLTKDLFYHLAREELDPEFRTPADEMTREMFLAMIAGGDTTATVLSNLFYSLLSDRRVMMKLQEEIDAAYVLNEDCANDQKMLLAMPYLNACINETLRLFPPVPSHVNRTPERGSGGKFIGGRFVPEGTTCFYSIYSIQRDREYYSPIPDVFWPERWIESLTEQNKNETGYNKIVHNREAFIPFSFGPAHCPGKFMAYNGMRVVVTRVLHAYDIEFADGYDESQWLEDLVDQDVIKKGALPVKLKERKC